jgi:UPF0755 protein
MKSLIYKILAVLILGAAVAITVVWMDYRSFLDTPMNVDEQGLVYTVKPGSNFIHIVRDLNKKGIIRKPAYLLWYARWNADVHKIGVGEYELTNTTTPVDLVHKLERGDVVQYSITVVEGWTFAQMMETIAANPYLDHTLKGLSGQQIMERLGYGNQHPEGRFMPDTYHFPRGTTDAAFLKRAHEAMQDYLKNEWEHRAVGLPLDSAYQALVLASIVEKETGLRSERKAIAGVFVRRLEKHMRLQSDPTVIYGMGDRYDGNIRRRDLRMDSPYNTYAHQGLPPTPIALPGRSAIHATLHPAEGDALYFVAKGDGSHHFSATLKEHNQAVIKYQLNGHDRNFSSHNNKKSQ